MRALLLTGPRELELVDVPSATVRSVVGDASKGLA
jgi:hypothetical protein